MAWTSYAKGNANVIVTDGNKLLRLNTLKNTREIIRFREKELAKYIGSYIVTTGLVLLRDEFVNEMSHKFNEDFDDLALLMPNLAEDTDKTVEIDHFSQLHIGASAIVWQFKPKWLVPQEYGCRNCSLNKAKNRNIGYCFLNLLDPEKVDSELVRMLPQAPAHFRALLGHYFKNDNVLTALRAGQECQTLIRSLEDEGDVTVDLLRSMALKDVTVFIRYDAHGLTSAIIDADIKPRSKWAYWKETEESIRNYAVHHQPIAV